jgi:microcin C transport system substrate-binding protein
MSRAKGRDVLDHPSTRAYNQSFQTFNSLNAFILKGEGAQGMDLTFAR